MHQPYYKDPLTGVYRFPWVRLHGIKDYYDMVTILEDFSAMHQTFNLTPSLIEQLMDYIEGDAVDRFFELSMVPAEDLTVEEKASILFGFFFANPENMIKPLPRYYELLLKRGKTVTEEDLRRATRYFSTQDFLDLQVLFNLSWFDPIFHERYPFLKELANKGRDYTEEEKKILLNTQIEAMRLIIPKYKEMKDKGQIEMTTSAFYHPILPLLYSTDSARVAMPVVKLPEFRFSHPEDAVAQVRMALEYFENIFGFRPEGMWPPEGAVSQETVKIIEQEGIKWIASDEGILASSLSISIRDSSGQVREPQKLYKPYRIGEGLSIIFRDHTLSDLIGFVYYKWDAKKAVQDFIDRLHRIRSSLPPDRAFLVPIILDGENAWEYYKNDGRDFLLYLYDALSRDEGIRTTTVSEYLREHPPEEYISNLFPGSWINSNFGIWIGHEEDNMAWDMLYETREELVTYQKLNPDADLKEAWKSIYIAEGSDWWWWYGDEHVTEMQKEFDELFRANLRKVYKLIGKEIPPKLQVPILRKEASVRPVVSVKGFITPRIDGEVTSYYEWLNSAYLDVERTAGAMHRATAFTSMIYYGFDLNNLYLRVDAEGPLIEISKEMTFSFQFLKPRESRLDVVVTQELRALFYRRAEEQWQFIGNIEGVAIKDILEVAVPFAMLNAQEGDEIAFFLSILRDGDEIERCPLRGYISLEAPTSRFEAMMWH
mgnify:CR=1 FL=1